MLTASSVMSQPLRCRQEVHVGSAGCYFHQNALATVVDATGSAESNGWPDPILEVQSAVPAARGVLEDTGALLSDFTDGRVAAIPVPMVAVQSGVATVLFVSLFLRLCFGSEVRAL
jgi:hypothetical protein